MRNVYTILVGKPEQITRSHRHRSDDIRMYLKEMVERVWTGCIWLRMSISDNEPSGS
jgi:hypothetical protein